MAVNFAEALEIAEVCYKHDLALMFWGPTSSGKSSVVKDLGKKLKMPVVDFRLSQIDAGELLGMPYEKDERMEYAAPAWWPKEGEKIILFLDELNRARNDIINAVFQLALDKAAGMRKLPEGCMVISACNPPGEYSVNELDPAMLSRFINLDVKLTLGDFEVYLKHKRLANKTLDFLRKMPDALYGPDMDSSMPKVQPVPRAWEKVAILEKDFEKMSDMAKYTLVMSTLGVERGTDYLTFIHGESPITGEELRNKFDEVIEALKGQVEQKNLGMVNVTMRQYLDIITRSTDSFTMGDYNKLIILCGIIPRDLMLEYVLQITKSPAVNKYHEINKKRNGELNLVFHKLDSQEA